MPEKEQQKILSGRNYPQSSRLRLSAAAIKDGYAALGKNNLDVAMKEFNRAWRFNQKNIDAYWGAAIVMSLKGNGAKSIYDAQKIDKMFAETVRKSPRISHTR